MYGWKLLKSFFKKPSWGKYDIFWQTFIEGIALFGAICLDQVTKMNRKRSVRREAEALLRKQR